MKLKFKKFQKESAEQWQSLPANEKFRFAIVSTLLFLSVFFTALGIEQFPFSDYPMFSEVQSAPSRLTLIATQSTGEQRLVEPSEIRPIGRIHLGYLIKNALNGHVSSRQSVKKLVTGLFRTDPKLVKIDIAVITISPPASEGVFFDYQILKSLESFSRETVGL